MLIGIFGSEGDPQCQQLTATLERKSHSALLIDADAIHQGRDHSIANDALFYEGHRLDHIGAYYLRHISTPMAPVFQMEGQPEPVLYRDWFNEYMHQRSRQELTTSLLLLLEQRGVCLVNPPFAGSVNQFKAFQLGSLRSKGIPLPKTLLTNNPVRVRSFRKKVGEVVFKPSTGGALCEPLTDEKLKELDLIRQNPVIFQECIHGEDVRVMVVNGEVVSSVIVDSETLDFRDDPNYSSGAGTYRELELPREVKGWCRSAAETLGLRFAGIDLKYCEGERFVFIEANSSPIYLDVELKLGHNITERLADYLLEQAEKGPRARKAPPGLQQHQRNIFSE